MTDCFVTLANMVLRSRGRPDFPMVVIPDGVKQMKPDALRSLASETFGRITAILTGIPELQATKAAPRAPA
ncbi:MAG: hypothetical protein HY684_03590 [Chloroflexi bacterium]|nr:hypothetical protein [Chloroflexota bacterium]